MGYKWTPDFEVKKPRPGGATTGGNSPRPQSYIGEYVTPIVYKGDGKQAVDPAPQQGFRKELPPIRTGSEVVEDFEPAAKLTIDDVYNKSKKSFGWK